MTESTSRVHDLAYPSPVTLKEISAIAIVAELRREKVASAEIKTKDVFDLAKDIPLKQIIPNLPSMIYDILDEYIAKLKLLSTAHWTRYVSNFDAFVWDWNGGIDDVRTAKRMMLCDRLAADEKFEIASKYCLEDDIRRLWPFVSSNINLDQRYFRHRPLLYYWVYCLRNELHNVRNFFYETIDETMFYVCKDRCQSYSSLEYFWNRIPYERRSLANEAMYCYDSGPFARFILLRLDDFQLETFVAKVGVDFMFLLLTESCLETNHVLPAWMYIRNKMNESQFIQLIEKLLKHETIGFYAKERLNSRDKVHFLCCEVWKNSAENLKRLAINDVLWNEELFKKTSTWPSCPREMRFLITILSDVSFEQRNTFWCKNWRNLIIGARVESLLRLMNLCFRDENDISLFIQQYISKRENIVPYCVQLLENACFDVSSEFLSFCYSNNQQQVRELKQQLLRSRFLGENSILRSDIIGYGKEMNAFVEDAFEDVDVRAEFKNQFVSSPPTQKCFSDCIRSGDFDRLIQFVEAFVPDERDVDVLKLRFLDNFTEHLVCGVMWTMEGDKLQKFLLWLLNSEDEIGKFKQSLSVDDIICNLIRLEVEQAIRQCIGGMGCPVKYPDSLRDFLNWYFNNNAEEIRKINERYSDELKMFRR
ncbi:uncharacterized protein LOC135839378 [Planococcus citri]|uniref:uncharacterized protein LOC135839378 n=1 Tax=Planococcus citri TaxID=170843 RepID=UPI0031FA192C